MKTIDEQWRKASKFAKTRAACCSASATGLRYECMYARMHVCRCVYVHVYVFIERGEKGIGEKGDKGGGRKGEKSGLFVKKKQRQPPEVQVSGHSPRQFLMIFLTFILLIFFFADT